MIWLIPAFFVTALLYAAVGFGGGSTYSALLSLAGFDYQLLPIVSLCCNVVVVSGSTIRFARAGITPWKQALTLALIAAPLAFLGGKTPINESSPGSRSANDMVLARVCASNFGHSAEEHIRDTDGDLRVSGTIFHMSLSQAHKENCTGGRSPFDQGRLRNRFCYWLPHWRIRSARVR